MAVVKSDFFLKFPNVAKHKIPALAEKGLARAGMLLLTDANTDIKKTPHDEGTLRASGSVFVGPKLIGHSPDPRGVGTPATDGGAELKKGLVATVAFNTPYAARLHNNPQFNFREEGTGGRYLASKLENNYDLYIQEVADTIREGGDDRA